MKNRIIYYIAPLIIFLFAFVVIQNNPQNKNKTENFSCTIELYKQNFAIGESIWVTINIKNTSNKKDSIKNLANSELVKFIQLTKSNNEIAEFLDVNDDHSNSFYCVFEPGETKAAFFQLNSNLGYNFASEKSMYYNYLPASTYIVKFALEEKTFKLESNSITFRIENANPVASEKMKELKSYLHIYHSSNDINIVEKFQEAIEDYKNTIFEQEFLILLLKFTKYGFDHDSPLYDSLLIKIENSIAKYPDSYNNLSLLSRYEIISKYIQKKPEKFELFSEKIHNTLSFSKTALFLDAVNRKSNFIK